MHLHSEWKMIGTWMAGFTDGWAGLRTSLCSTARSSSCSGSWRQAPPRSGRQTGGGWDGACCRVGSAPETSSEHSITSGMAWKGLQAKARLQTIAAMQG